MLRVRSGNVMKAPPAMDGALCYLLLASSLSIWLAIGVNSRTTVSHTIVNLETAEIVALDMPMHDRMDRIGNERAKLSPRLCNHHQTASSSRTRGGSPGRTRPASPTEHVCPSVPRTREQSRPYPAASAGQPAGSGSSGQTRCRHRRHKRARRNYEHARSRRSREHACGRTGRNHAQPTSHPTSNSSQSPQSLAPEAYCRHQEPHYDRQPGS